MAKVITLLLPVFSLLYLWQSYLLPSGNVLIGARTFPLMVGGIMLVAAVNTWRAHDFGRLNYADTMRVVVPGVTLVVLGYQTVFSCFFLSLLGLRRR